MLVVKNSQSLYRGFLRLFIVCFTALREQRRRDRFAREVQRLDPHLLADVGFLRQDDGELVSLKSDRANVNNALASSHRRQARLKTAFLVRRRQALRNGRSGP
jgi:hypothetical protein